MKKIYILLMAFMLGMQVKAQTLNQSAGWPNASWTITGTYNPDPASFEADPRTSPNFAFDDDDAGSGSDDGIAAESPVVNLAAAFAAGEKFLEVSVSYTFHLYAEDVLRLEYWNAATSTWIPWGGNLPNTDEGISNNFCDSSKVTFISETLDITSFTSTQLSGFKYRIFYDDGFNVAGYNYGFCFDSPVIKSFSCGAPMSLAATSVSATAAIINWTGTAANFEYVLSAQEATPTVAGTQITATTNNFQNLSPSTTYYFYVRSLCTGSQSSWRMISFTTNAVAPLNDGCAGAIALVVNPNLQCTSVTAGTLEAATDSGEAEAEIGTPDDDVWYKFVATATTHSITISDVEGDAYDLVHQIFEGTCGGGLVSLNSSDPNVSVVSGLTVGNTYYVRVFSYYEDPGVTTFDICIGTYPPAPENDSCSTATALAVNPNLQCTLFTSGTLTSSTPSGEPDGGVGNPDDDVWYSFVATAPVQGIKISNVEGNVYDLVHQVLEGTCGGGLISLAISDPDSSVISGLTIGQTYYVRVFSYGDEAGATTSFDICITTYPPAPANDDCSTATPVVVNTDANCASTVSGTLASATASSENYDGEGTPDDDVWYSFVANETEHKISISNVEGNETDLVHEILEGTCGGGLISLRVNHEDATTIAGLTVGNTYFIRIFSYTDVFGATTTFDVCVGVPPAGAVCENPIVISGLPFTASGDTAFYGDNYDFESGSNSGCESTSNSYLLGDDVVYAYTPAEDQSISIRIPDAPGWSAMFVYDSCGAIGSGAIACASDSNEGDREINELPLTGGTTYYIVLSTYPSPQSFEYTLNIIQNTCINSAVDFDIVPNCATVGQFLVDVNISGLGSATSLTVADNRSSAPQQVTTTGTVRFGPYANGTPVIFTVSNNQDPNCVVTSDTLNQTDCPPVNDNCSTATVLVPGGFFTTNSVIVTNAGATSSDFPDPGCANYMGGEVWYSVVVPPSGNLTLETNNNDSGGSQIADAGMSVYSGSCASLTLIECDDDDSEDGNFSKISLIGRTPGEIVYVSVWEYGNDVTGTFRLSAYDSSLSTTAFDNASFKAYPNPVKNSLNLSYVENISSVAVYNLVGQQLFTKKIDATEGQIDMSNLTQGTYLVKITVGNEVKTLKIMKQ